jgi:hypothetical protein
MAKTLNHYSQQIKALAPDALVLDRARELGTLLLEAKAAVQAADRKWTDWLEADCSLTARTAQRFMTIARRWDEPAFAEARTARPDLPLREADKVLAENSTRKRVKPGAAKQQPLSAKLWQRSSLSDEVIHYCPVCCESAKGKREQTIYCAGKTLNFSSHPKAKAEPHEPVQMICSCQGGFDHEPHFMLKPVDLSSYKALPAVIPLAKQIHAVMKQPLYFHATWFEISCAGYTVDISNAADPDQFPGISLMLDDDHNPVRTFIGSSVGSHLDVKSPGINTGGEWREIEGSAAGVKTEGECSALMPTWELLRKALGW